MRGFRFTSHYDDKRLGVSLKVQMNYSLLECIIKHFNEILYLSTYIAINKFFSR